MQRSQPRSLPTATKSYTHKPQGIRYGTFTPKPSRSSATWNMSSYNWPDYRVTDLTWMDPFEGFQYDKETFRERFIPSQMAEDFPGSYSGYPGPLPDLPPNP